MEQVNHSKPYANSTSSQTNMKTTELNGTEYTLTEGEGGKITLTPLREIIEKRTPEAGDVYTSAYASWLVCDDKSWVDLTLRFASNAMAGEHDFGHSYLGKFDEVYVNRAEFISDIREALSHKDFHGDSILNSTGCSVTVTGLEKSRKALRKLNIITD